jgi:hypothetical protein
VRSIVRAAAAAAAVMSVFASATSAFAADPGSAAQLAARGIALAPDEQNAKVVIVGGQPGSQQSAVVTPGGCRARQCQSLVTSAVPATATAQPLSVIAVNHASVDVSTSPAAPIAAPQLQALASVWVRGLDFNDQFCSNLTCTAWHFNMGSREYYEGYYAWGSRSRYGYAGWATCTAGAVGYSASLQQCQFFNDPHPSELYASAQYHISAPWPISISQDHYLHRHVDKNGNYWLVAN